MFFIGGAQANLYKVNDVPHGTVTNAGMILRVWGWIAKLPFTHLRDMKKTLKNILVVKNVYEVKNVPDRKGRELI